MTREKELDTFEKIFLKYLEYPSMRWHLKKIIDSYDKVDFAELDVKLRKLDLEITKKRKGGD